MQWHSAFAIYTKVHDIYQLILSKGSILRVFVTWNWQFAACHIRFAREKLSDTAVPRLKIYPFYSLCYACVYVSLCQYNFELVSFGFCCFVLNKSRIVWFASSGVVLVRSKFMKSWAISLYLFQSVKLCFAFYGGVSLKCFQLTNIRYIPSAKVVRGVAVHLHFTICFTIIVHSIALAYRSPVNCWLKFVYFFNLNKQTARFCYFTRTLAFLFIICHLISSGLSLCLIDFLEFQLVIRIAMFVAVILHCRTLAKAVSNCQRRVYSHLNNFKHWDNVTLNRIDRPERY